ncbi:MAG: hypothetical protein V1673_02820 [Candidatus Omnitrophota bacterium]
MKKVISFLLFLFLSVQIVAFAEGSVRYQFDSETDKTTGVLKILIMDTWNGTVWKVLQYPGEREDTRESRTFVEKVVSADKLV